MSLFDFIGYLFSFASIVLLYCTYAEQRRTNLVSRFESSFWKIGGNNAHYDSNWERELKNVDKLIKCHFNGSREIKISASQLGLLLNFYWKQIEANEDSLTFSFKPYFLVLEERLNYIYNQAGNLIDSADIKFYVNIVLSELSSNALLPFYSFICSEVYSHRLPELMLSRICNEIGDILKVTEHSKDYKILNYSQEEDYGCNYSECKNEHYTETIKRLNINE